MGVMKRLYEQRLFGKGETAQERHEAKWLKAKPKPQPKAKPKKK